MASSSSLSAFPVLPSAFYIPDHSSSQPVLNSASSIFSFRAIVLTFLQHSLAFWYFLRLKQLNARRYQASGYSSFSYTTVSSTLMASLNDSSSTNSLHVIILKSIDGKLFLSNKYIKRISITIHHYLNYFSQKLESFLISSSDNSQICHSLQCIYIFWIYCQSVLQTLLTFLFSFRFITKWVFHVFISDRSVCTCNLLLCQCEFIFHSTQFISIGIFHQNFNTFSI